MNKINEIQLFSLLLLSGVWSVLCMTALSGTGEMAGAAAACGCEVLLCLPLLRRDAPSLTAALRRSPWIGWVFAGYFLLRGGLAFAQLYDAAPKGLFSMPGTLTAAVLVIVTCLYTSTAGLKAAARSAPLLLLLLLLAVGVLVVGAWKRAVPDRLFPQLSGAGKGFLDYVSASGEAAAVWVLLSRVKAHGSRAVILYFPAKLGLFLLLFCLSIATGGRLAGTQAHPFLTLTAMCQPLEGQRVDALYLLEFVMLFILHITMLTGMTAHIAALLHPRLTHTAPAALVVMLLLAWLLPAEALQAVTLLLLPLLCGMPLLTGVRHRERRTAV